MKIRKNKEGKIITIVVLGYYLIGMLFGIWIDCEFQAEYDFAFKYLAVPSIIASYLAFAFFFRKEFRLRRPSVNVLLPALFGVVFVAGSGGYVRFLNTVIDPQIPYIVQGKVVNKDWIRGKSSGRSYYFDVESKSAQGTDTIRLDVDELDYTAVEIGEVYMRPMTRGGLGFLYRKRW